MYDLKVSPLGFGTWSWGNKLLWNYDTRMDPELERALLAAVQTNQNRKVFIDTGDSYGTGKLQGRAESLLGNFCAQNPIAERRALIGTKLAVYPTRLTAGSFVEACRASLTRLKMERIDLVQAHWSAQNFQPWQEGALWDGLAQCYEIGLASGVGTSNFGPRALERVNRFWSDRGVPHVSNQFQFSLLSTLPLETGMLEACADLGVAPIAYSPLGLGVLSGKYDLDNLPSGARGLLFKALIPSCGPLLGTLRAIGDERGVSMSSVAINWAMSKGAIVIVGLRSVGQALESADSLSFRLDDGEVEDLERSAKSARRATQNIFQTD